jgi:hypothetical protein
MFLLVVATAASAQSLSATPLKVDFGATALQPATPAPALPVSFSSEVAAPPRGSSMSWTPVILAGLAFGGGGGFAVGGGVNGDNLAGHENYALGIDGYWANVGGGCAFDECSVTQIAIAVQFLYKFAEMSSGWVPFVGGGLGWSRVSFSFDDNFFCDVTFFDCSASASAVGFVVSGGMDKNNIGFEVRLGGANGTGGALFFRFRPKKK